MDSFTMQEMATLRAVLAKVNCGVGAAEGVVRGRCESVRAVGVDGVVGAEKDGGASVSSGDSGDGGRGVLVSGSDGAASDGSGSSWADQVEDELHDGGCCGAGGSSGGAKVLESRESPVQERVTMPGLVSCGAKPPGLRFGGMMDEVACSRISHVGGENFYRDHVRIPRVKGLKAFLERNLGVRLPKQCLQELALATHALACVPDAFVDGQKRVRGLAAVGDAALTNALVVHEYVSGTSVASMQAVRSVSLSNGVMGRAYVRMGFVSYSVFPAGISLENAKTGADLFEAVAGVLSLWRGPGVLRAYMEWAGVIRT